MLVVSIYLNHGEKRKTRKTRKKAKKKARSKAHLPLRHRKKRENSQFRKLRTAKQMHSK